MWLEFIFGLLTFLIVWDILNKRRRHRMIQECGIKGPTPLPLVGNAWEFVGNDTANFFKLTQKWRSKYGKVCRIWMVSECMVFAQDVRIFESVLRSQQLIKKGNLYNLLNDWLGNGLLMSTGSKWHSRRKIITPTFHFKILEQFVEIFDRQSAVMVKRLQKKADGKTVINMFPEICLTALDIIAETAMGVCIQAQEHPEFEYAKAVTDASNAVAMRIMKPFDRIDWYYRVFNSKAYEKLNKDIEIMHDFTNKVIEDRRDELQKSIEKGTYDDNESNTTNDVGLKKRMAFLDVLLQATVDGKPLSNQDIREEVDTFMFEGHDTTTSGISFTCYLLSRHPEVQQKVLSEIKEVIGEDRNQPVTMQKLNELKYLECVIKEGLRLYPPVAIIGRLTETDIKLDNLTIPANTNVSLNIYAANRDPDYFQDPDSFKPERFLDTDINPFAYVPFSAGPRNCVGQKFAILEMKSTISKMIRHYELLPLGEEVVPAFNIILRSATGINLGLRPRT